MGWSKYIHKYFYIVFSCPSRKLPNSVKLRSYYAVQGHPRSPSLVPIESSYATSYFLLVINSNLGLPHILQHRFRDIALERSKIATFFYPSLVNPLPPTEGFPWDDLRKIFIDGQRYQMA